MNQCVPDFETPMDDQNMPSSSSSSSGLPRQKKPSIADEDIVELLWQNGQIVTQNQNHRQFRKSPPARNTDESPSSARPEVENYNQFLFLQEGEMASWLHYPIQDLDQNFSTDFLNSPPPINNNSSMQTLPRTSQLTELRQPPMSVAPPRPPIPRPNFACFSRNGARAEPISRTTARESTVVDSCDTPAFPPPVTSETARSSAEPTEGGVAAPSTTFDCEPGGSSSSGEPVQKVMEKQDRKRKGREVEEWEYQSEDVYFESAEAKKNVVGSTSTKRSRAAEVHNLSERRRRDRINEKMRALQELIPRCNKSDKASMLDEAIEYLKSLQLQVQRVQHMQMMSMGCGMVPMMFPGIQQYMPSMGMGLGMGMETGMNRPVMPFPNMLAGSAMPVATAAAHMGPRFAMPPFHMSPVPTPDPSRVQAANQSDNNIHTLIGTPDPNQSCIPNFTNPYQQYPGPHQIQFQLMQNQAMNQQNVDKPSISGALENPENHQSGEK